MFVSGFSIVRNAIKYDYPIVEAIRSILPVCDEFVIAVGKSDDDTLNLIRSINDPKIRIIETAISEKADWCFYIQGDEVIHEQFLPAIKAGMQQWKDDKNVEGLLFDYTHFYGSYDYVGDSRKWYRKEIRVVRKDKTIRSYKDAQGFRHVDNSKLKVKAIDASVYHYGWVKPPEAQQAKQQSFHKMWHDDQWMKENVPAVDKFDYSQIDSLAKFTGTHPLVMHDRIRRMNWKFSFDPTRKRWGIKMRLLMFAEKTTGVRIGEYKNYTLI
jgi:hypothetical protein